MTNKQTNEHAGFVNARERENRYVYTAPARYCGICGTWLLETEHGECATCTDMFGPSEVSA